MKKRVGIGRFSHVEDAEVDLDKMSPLGRKLAEIIPYTTCRLFMVTRRSYAEVRRRQGFSEESIQDLYKVWGENMMDSPTRRLLSWPPWLKDDTLEAYIERCAEIIEANDCEPSVDNCDVYANAPKCCSSPQPLKSPPVLRDTIQVGAIVLKLDPSSASFYTATVGSFKLKVYNQPCGWAGYLLVSGGSLIRTHADYPTAEQAGHELSIRLKEFILELSTLLGVSS